MALRARAAAAGVTPVGLRPPFVTPAAAHSHPDCRWILTLIVARDWCEQHVVAYQGVQVGTIKRFATGKGNADKAAMLAAMQARGFSPADDNEADALAILLWAIETQGGVR